VRAGGLRYGDETHRRDRELVLEAVRRNGEALQFADKWLLRDREVVLEALRHDGCLLRFADKVLRADREVVLQAVRQAGEALQFAEPSVRGDRRLAPEAVARNCIAVPGMRAPVVSLASAARKADDLIEVCFIFGIGGSEASLSLDASETLGGLAARVVEACNVAGGHVHLIGQRNRTLSPMSVDAPLIDFLSGR